MQVQLVHTAQQAQHFSFIQSDELTVQEEITPA